MSANELDWLFGKGASQLFDEDGNYKDGTVPMMVEGIGVITDVACSEALDSQKYGYTFMTSDSTVYGQIDNYSSLSTINTSDNSYTTITNHDNAYIGTINTGTGSNTTINNRGIIDTINVGENGTAEIYNYGTITNIIGGDITDGTEKGMYIKNDGDIKNILTGKNSTNYIINNDSIDSFTTGEGNTSNYSGNKAKKITTGKDSTIKIFSDKELKEFEKQLNNFNTPEDVKNKIKKYITDSGATYYIDSKTREYVVKNKTDTLVTAAQLKKFGWRDTSDAFVKQLNDALVRYGITDKESICLFMATIAAESDFGRVTLEEGSDAYFNENGYDRYTRGAGYGQITHKAEHLAFLKSDLIKDSFSGKDTAAYIGNKYPILSATWEWSKAPKSGEGNLNTYVTKNGGSLGIFLITQYYINGFVKKEGFNDDLVSIRNGGSFSISKDKEGKSSSLSVNGHTYRLPNGWDKREDAYNKAIKAFDN